MKAADHIVSDLMRKCGQDVHRQIMLSAGLVDDFSARAVIAVGGTAQALGAAVAFFMRTVTDGTTAEQGVDALWEKIRPLAVNAVAEILSTSCPAPGAERSAPGDDRG